MNAPRILQFVGLLIVSATLAAALFGSPSMTVEFGGVILGGVVFVVGRMLATRQARG